MEIKTCKKCGIEKPLSEFEARYEKPGKFRDQCIICQNLYRKKWYAEKKGIKRLQRKEIREADPKFCVACKTEKRLTEFGWHDQAKGQHRSICKVCVSEHSHGYYQSPKGKKKRESWMRKNKDLINRYKELYRLRDLAHPEQKKEKNHEYRLKHDYKMSKEEYDQRLKDQNGQCAICGKEKPYRQEGKKFTVDHDHETGKLRGLLCINCNAGLGHFKDDPSLLRSAIDYLRRY